LFTLGTRPVNHKENNSLFLYAVNTVARELLRLPHYD
jgi:hypothetical protein